MLTKRLTAFNSIPRYGWGPNSRATRLQRPLFCKPPNWYAGCRN